MKIGVPRERRSDERRVAATPDTVKRLKTRGVEVVIERGAGDGALINDGAYEDAGATIVGDAAATFAADVVLKVRRPLAADENGDGDEMGRLRQGQVLVGMLNPYLHRDQIEAYAKAGVVAFALELMPRTTRAQSMDVLSSQANLAGYRAVIDAAAEYARVMPMMMTAAGTVAPARVFVLGAGVAGLQAIATARRLGAIVSATDVRPAAKEEVESLGARFVGVPLDDAAGTGGYAKELTPEQGERQAEMVAEHLKGQDIVITTALVPGRKAPVLVTRAMVESMRPGAVIVDLAVENGGNCELSEPDQVVRHNGVSVVGHLNMPSRLAPAASSLYARNVSNFVELLVDKEGVLSVNEEDDLVKGTLLTKDGQVVHAALTDKSD